MNIKIEDLHPNPFRDIDNYPMDVIKIKALKESIDQTGFWDNLVVRPTNGWIILEDMGDYVKHHDFAPDEPEYFAFPMVAWNGDEDDEPNEESFELAYGHHRLKALKELGVEYVDLPVRDLDDATMLHIMAQENRNEYKASPMVLVETVKAVRDYLNAELAKADINPSLINLSGLEGRHTLEDLRTKGVGRETILKFLGNSWKQWEIQESLAQLDFEKKSPIAKKVVQKLPSMTHVKNFNAAIKKAEKNSVKFTDKELVKLADDIVKDDVSKRNVANVIESRVVEKMRPKNIDKKVAEKINKKVIEFDLFITETTDVARDMIRRLKVIDSLKDTFKEVTKENVVHRGICVNELSRVSDKVTKLIEFLSI